MWTNDKVDANVKPDLGRQAKPEMIGLIVEIEPFTAEPVADMLKTPYKNMFEVETEKVMVELEEKKVDNGVIIKHTLVPISRWDCVRIFLGGNKRILKCSTERVAGTSQSVSVESFLTVVRG